MSYPQGERYLETIKKNPAECERIKEAFYLLKAKREKDWPKGEDDENDLEVQFSLLGEAFELASKTLDVPDRHHFMDDVLLALLTPERRE